MIQKLFNGGLRELNEFSLGQPLLTITKQNPTTQVWRFANTLCDGTIPYYILRKKRETFPILIEEFGYPSSEDLTGLPNYTEYPKKSPRYTREHFHLLRV